MPEIPAPGPAPSAAAAPSAKSRFVLIVAGVVLLPLLGCCIFAIVGSQLDTDFQKKQAQKLDAQRGELVAFRTKLAAVAAKLPAAGSLQGEKRLAAAAGTLSGEPILTDAVLLGGYQADGKVVATGSTFFHDQDLLHMTSLFVDNPKLEELDRFAVEKGAAVAKQLLDRGVLAVFFASRLDAPQSRGEDFVGGKAEGQLALISIATGEVLAHGPYAARSSEKISYGGGVGIRIGPVRVGSVGGSKLDEALAQDFCANCNKAAAEAIERLKKPE
jgi:hypothetical protein